MKNLLVLIAAILLPMFAQAAECPVSFERNDYLGDVVAEIQKTKNCYKAVAVAESCALGSSGDATIVGAVVPLCESGFLSKLSREEFGAYQNLQTKCYQKYMSETGTMYRSAEAFCAMDVSKLHFQIFSGQ